MIICLTERLKSGEKEVRRRQRTLKPEYEETWAAVDQPQGEKLSFQPSWESTEKEVWLIHIRSNMSFINTRTPSREAHLESSRKWHWQIKGPLENTKEIHVKAQSSKPCDYTVTSHFPFLWAFLTEVSWGLILVCECGGGEEPGMGIETTRGEKSLSAWYLPPLPVRCS